MKKIKFILYILCILICNMYLQAQETKALKIDSIKLDKFPFYGISLFPEDTAEVNRTGVYLCLKDDSLIIVSDNSKLFYNRIYQLKDKKSIVKAFSNYKICFSDDLPISVAIYNNFDTILYSKTPPRTNKYKLESAVINDTIFQLGNIKVGMSSEKLCKELGIDTQYIKDINHIFILKRIDNIILNMWYAKYNLPYNIKDNSCFSSIQITLNKDRVFSMLISDYYNDLIIDPRFRSRYGEVMFCD